MYRDILQKTYRDYLPNAEQSTITETEFIQNNMDRIILSAEKDLPFQKSESAKFNYGIIVFCPHTGKPDKNGKRSELGVLTYYDFLRPRCLNDKIVYFSVS